MDRLGRLSATRPSAEVTACSIKESQRWTFFWFPLPLVHFLHTGFPTFSAHISFLLTVSLPMNSSASSSTTHFSFYPSSIFSTMQISRRKLSLSKLLTKPQRKPNKTAMENLLVLGYFSYIGSSINELYQQQTEDVLIQYPHIVAFRLSFYSL